LQYVFFSEYFILFVNILASCTPDDFICKNGQCINGTYRCDGLPQCRDGSDEVNCNVTVPCTEFECDNKKCVPKSAQCDGVIDCSANGEDNSDERNCNTTVCDIDSGREFHCHNKPTGKCLPIDRLCDGHDDCGDGSDELNCNCTCGANMFSCKSLCQCISIHKRCDGTYDCKDKSDEVDCKCNQGEYTCQGGYCINATKLCNGFKDCPKGDDETYPDCCKYYFVVVFSSRSCILSIFYSDSTTALPTTTTTIAICNTATCLVDGVEVCIPEQEICDGEKYCDDETDECAEEFPNNPNCTTTPAPCTEFVCDITSEKPSGTCLNKTRVCDGYADCFDKSDESAANCNYTTTTTISTVSPTLSNFFLFYFQKYNYSFYFVKPHHISAMLQWVLKMV